MIIGKQSMLFEKKVYIESAASIVGKKEGQGPLGSYFDIVAEDEMLGKNNWEEAESEFQKKTMEKLIIKWGGKKEDIRYVFAGDLLGQLIATSFGLKDLEIPMFGLYGACSTFGEAMLLSSMTVSAEYADNVAVIVSSHFASSEKQFRFPLDYGNQRPLASTWTVTGCGGVILGNSKSSVYVKAATVGKIVDFGIKDSMNMGACMAPAAADVIAANLEDFKVDENFYDKIITGDLGRVGRKILIDLLKEKGIDISQRHMDCGIEIFDPQNQNTHSGGSGCACSAVTFCSYILKLINEKKWKRILFIPTGALLSSVTYNEGRSVPGIAHAIVVERV